MRLWTVSRPDPNIRIRVLIVSGDNDLLSLSSFQGIPIIAPAEAVTLIEATGKT